MFPAKSYCESNSLSSIALFKCVAAGDYYYHSIFQDNNMISIRLGRQYDIIEFRSGVLDKKMYENISQSLEKINFKELEREYHLPPPDKDEPPVEYEDVYYFLAKPERDNSNSVLFHEYATPKLLHEIVSTITNSGDALPKSQLKNSFITSLPDSLFSCLREDRNLPPINIDEVSIAAYPSTLQQAITSPASLIKISEENADKFKKSLFGSSKLRRILKRGEEMAILLLE